MSELAGHVVPARRHRRSEITSFADVAWAHHRHWALRAEGHEQSSAATQEYGAVRRRFEAQQGRIVEEYWCSSVPSGAAVTLRRRWRHLPLPRRLQFHRVSDWATPASVGAASLLRECDELAVKVGEVLWGTSQRICMGLLFRSAGNALALVDAASKPQRAAAVEAAIAEEKSKLAETERYYEATAGRQAQLVYVFGMAAGFAAIVVLILGALACAHFAAGVSWTLDHGQLSSGISGVGLVVCGSIGALGAVASVVQRVSGDEFSLDFDVGRATLMALGALRPFIGAVSALTVYLAIASGLLQVLKVPDEADRAFAFFVVVSFAAGFSERWASDVLIGITRASSPTGGSS